MADDVDDDADDADAHTNLPDEASLIAFIGTQATPPKIREIARAFNIRAEGRAALRRKLRTLADAGKITHPRRKRITTPDTLPPVGVVEVASITNDGDAIAAPGEAHTDSKARITIRLDKRRGKALTPGDRVLARLKKTAPDRYEGQVIRKLGHQRKRFFGVVFMVANGYLIESVERNAKAPALLLPPPPDSPVANGDMVEAEFVASAGYGAKQAKLIRNLGPADAPGAFSALAIAEFALPHTFSDEALGEAAAAREPELGQREDLRPIPLVTIDGADARDFDDAVFAAPQSDGGHRLIVAIADVSHYVKPNSTLDLEARKRGNSVYLPDRVVPMLPEALSNGLCSLMAGEDRACLAVEMAIAPDGTKRHHRFFRGLMRSHARLTYDGLEEYRNGRRDALPESLTPDVIDNLFAAYEALAEVRRGRGALELDLPEKRVRFDDDGTPLAIARTHQSVSQKLIEEFMILANVCAAETLEEAGRLCVFRAHERPDGEKIQALHDMTKQMGLPFPKGQVIKAAHFNRLLKDAAGVVDAAALALLNETVLRCQSQADYRITNPGHFGLALRRYAHFTSPIRRYADLMVHRQIINMLTPKQAPPEDAIPEPDPDEAAEAAHHISQTERQAAAAERRTIDRFAAALIHSRQGDITTGIIRGITRFGAFVEIENSGIEGLLPMARLPDDYYDADTARGVITGRSSGLTLRIGDEISVMIAEVSPIKASVTLGYADGGGGLSGAKPGRGRGKKLGKKPGKHRKSSRSRKSR